MNTKEEYDILKDSGDLEILFPGLTGNWDKDKTQFTKMWKMNQEIINNNKNKYK
jgi:hypothetical protein